MPLIDRFDTPARWRDFADDSPFYPAWDQQVAVLAGFDPGPDAGPAPDGPAPDGPAPDDGGPVPTIPPEQMGSWADPRAVEASVVETRTLSWIGMSRAFLTVRHRDDRAAAFRETDADRLNNQPEYFEWRVFRDETSGKIVKVVFTTESWQYWELLARTDRNRLVELYRELVDPAVQEADLFQTDEQGAEVYDRENVWNTERGIVHLVGKNPGNGLNQILGLCVGGTLNNRIDNFAEAAASADHAVDDYTVYDVGAVARKGFDIAPHDPVGLYIEGWDDTGFTAPDSSPAGDYWRITRGRPGQVLRLEYEVPHGEGFVVGDIRIGGRPIEFGSQLAEHIHSVIHVDVLRRAS